MHPTLSKGSLDNVLRLTSSCLHILCCCSADWNLWSVLGLVHTHYTNLKTY